MEKLIDKSCIAFTELLAAKVSVPGGGGASALVGALGTALCSMTGNFTLGKKTYAAVEDDVHRLMEQAEDIQNKLLALVDADAEAFEPLSRAYALPQDAPDREAIMEQCLRDAAATPMEILRLSCQAIELHREMGEKGSVMMLSDVGTGVIFCKSALLGAVLNVKINTKSMTDRAYAEAMNAEADALVEKYQTMADEVYGLVWRRFS